MRGVSEEDLCEVSIIGFPVQIHQRAQEHLDDLLREFMLIAAASEQGPRTHVPRQLLDLVEEIQRDFAGTTLEQDAKVLEARENGATSVDLVYRMPSSVAKAAIRLGEALDAADSYCLAGEHLLTLATPPDALDLRRWYFGEFVGQISGAPPTPWPDWVAANPRQSD
ncbi:MAG TPA: hypothetical protein VNF71_06955 [Acidimicrobiales bacterium]|nr:hypothetical protein [Acidimicrobiales bacterium]